LNPLGRFVKFQPVPRLHGILLTQACSWRTEIHAESGLDYLDVEQIFFRWKRAKKDAGEWPVF